MALARNRFGVLLLALSVLLVTVGLPRVAVASESAAGDVAVAAAPGRVLVTWEAWATEAARADVRQRHGLVVRDAIDALDFEVLRIPGGIPADVAVGLTAEPAVAIAEPDYVLEAEAVNDPDFPELWGLHNTGQSGGTVDVDIDAPEAWDITMGSSSVIVAVIDTGVQITHPDLAANIWTNPGETPGNSIDDDGNGYVDDVNGWDFYYDNATVYDSASEDDHGTHVAGTIAATANNGIGVVGVAPNVKIMPLKFLGGSSSSGFTSDAILAVNYAAAKGAKVINASWGGGGLNETLKSAIESSGAVFAAAAGNSTNNNDASPFYPASYASANILSVAAVTRSGDLADFSNYGATSVDVSAPGVSIRSTWPADTYASLQGTSMAAPHVAGIAALVSSVDPSLTPTQIVDAVKAGARPLASLSGKTLTGGLVNAMEAARPYGAPGAPTGVTADAGHEKATVGWTAPTTGAAPTSYAVTVSPTTGVTGGTTRALTAPGTSIDFTGLTNGTSYTFTVTASNAHGTSAASDASNAVMPNPTVPDAPSGVAVVPGDGQLSVSWTAPPESGSALTGYTVTATPPEGDATLVNISPVGDNLATSAVVTGLVNATAYAITVTATNDLGTSLASAAVSGTPRTVPDAPTGIAATGANTKATVTWTAPAFNGGSVVTGYTVTATPGEGLGVTTAVAANGDGSVPTSAVVTGLTNGTTYAVTVAATNAAGTGAASAATTIVPTETVPGPPTIASATAGDGQASVTWSAPADDGGTPITAYTVTASPGGATATTDGSTTSATVTGLTNGTAYTFTVAATNVLGTGSASPASSSVTPAAPAPPPSSGGGFSGGGGGGGTAPAPAPTAPATGTASGEVAAGGTITTDPAGTGATPASPVQTKITSPVAGSVDVTAGAPTTAAPSGWRLIDHEVTITAPAATPEAPLAFEFHLDGSIDASGVTVFRNGAEVGECLGASVADPDPCVTARSTNGDDTVVTVLTSRASRWNFGFVAGACPDVRVAASSFTDLGSSPHAASVECIAWWGAASGVSTTSFAPTNTVTRAQMASFVARTLESAGIDLPTGTDRFTDDDATPHEASINALAAAGIVSGVGGDRYDPGGSVTRAQMATFLIKAARYATGEGLVATVDEFSDDDGSPHEASINAVRASGLANGTGAATFNPDGHVTREQMATFLVNLLDLLVDRGLARPPAI